MADYPPINLIDIMNSDQSSCFIDPHFKSTLTEISSTPDSMVFTITSRQIYQVIVNDKSVLAVQAKSKDNDPKAVTLKQMETVAKATRKLPPAIAHDKAISQLQSRGFFSSILGLGGNLLGGVAEALTGGAIKQNDVANITKGISSILP